jgi:hypothetical protein
MLETPKALSTKNLMNKNKNNSKILIIDLKDITMDN